MKVFLASASFAASYGGPAYSVSRLASALDRAGVRTGIWAPDGSACAVDADKRVERFDGALDSALACFGTPDVLHDSGIWLAHNHALAQWASRRSVPRIVSTRGMLEPWARRHKGWKKMLAWAGYQRRDLQSAQLLHATTEAEALNLRGMRLGPVEVIPNGVDPPAWSFPRGDADDGSRTALFLGRLYPVKGLPMLIEAWSRVRPKDWRLEIAGPDEAGHRAELEALVQKTGLADVVAFRGPLAGRDKGEALASADLFVLPSHSESFGIVVAEALAHGAPVLTTTAVPWKQLERQACGWRVAPSVSALAEGLSAATGLSRGHLREMGQRGRVLVLAEYGWERVAQAFMGAYERLARGARRNHKTLTQAA